MTNRANLAILRTFKKGEFATTLRLQGTLGDWTIGRDGQPPSVLPSEALEFLIHFGLQSLQDAYAGKHGADAVKAFDDKFEKLMAGEVSLEDRCAVEMLRLVPGGAERIKAATTGLKGRAIGAATLRLAREIVESNAKFAAMVATLVASKNAANADTTFTL